MKIHLIRTDGTEQHVDAPFGAIAGLLGARMLDTVNLQDGRIMLVDDGGWKAMTVEHSSSYSEQVPLYPVKPINRRATELYHGICKPGTTHQIAGDVAIVVDAEVA